MYELMMIILASDSGLFRPPQVPAHLPRCTLSTLGDPPRPGAMTTVMPVAPWLWPRRYGAGVAHWFWARAGAGPWGGARGQAGGGTGPSRR